MIWKEKGHHHNIILTGIPRAGTTLSCHLLNKVADTVALHEPIVWDRSVEEPDHTVVCAEIDAFFEQTRRSVLQTRSAISQQLKGSVPDNPMGNYPIWAGWIPDRLLAYPIFRRVALRTYRVSRGKITVAKTLNPNFSLCIKHTGPFTTLLNTLLRKHRCYAIVRNPLSVLLSWNSINFALREGHLSEAEWLDVSLSRQLAQISDRFERQISLLSWFFRKYRVTLPASNIIRYEDIIATGGRALGVIVAEASELDEQLENKNRNSLYNDSLLYFLAEALLNSDGAFWEFYTRESVRSLCESAGL